MKLRIQQRDLEFASSSPVLKPGEMLTSSAVILPANVIHRPQTPPPRTRLSLCTSPQTSTMLTYFPLGSERALCSVTACTTQGQLIPWHRTIYKGHRAPWAPKQSFTPSFIHLCPNDEFQGMKYTQGLSATIQSPRPHSPELQQLQRLRQERRL